MWAKVIKLFSFFKRKPKDFYSGDMSFEEEEDWLQKHGRDVKADVMSNDFNDIYAAHDLPSGDGWENNKIEAQNILTKEMVYKTLIENPRKSVKDFDRDEKFGE